MASGFSELRWERPDWWLWMLSATAWIVFLVDTVTPEPRVHDQHPGMIMGSAPALRVGPVAVLLSWTVMVVAMMLPLSAGPGRWLAHRSLARRRTRTIMLHTVAYVVVWLALGAALAPVVEAIASPRTVAVAALVVAAGWQLAPMRRRVLRRCGAGEAPAVRGWSADLDCLRAGARTGRRCVITCGPAMVAMIAMHSLAIMVALTVVIASERRSGPNPEERAGRPLEAIALLAIATGAWVLSSS